MDLDRTVNDLLLIAKDIGYGHIPLYQHNECFTSGAFDLIVFSGTDSAQNFTLLSAVCERYSGVKADKKFLKGFLYLLNQLSYSTQTTERPDGLMKIIEENPEDTRELQEWYRTAADNI